MIRSILAAFIRKELLQVRRNPMMLLVIFLIPIVQLVVLVFAANPVMKNIALCVVDSDRSVTTQRLLSSCYASGYFKEVGRFDDRREALRTMEVGDADALLEFPPNFESDMVRGESPALLVTADAVNGMKGLLAANYLQQLLGGTMGSQIVEVELTYSEWYNPLRDHKSYMLPGILGMLLTAIAIMLSSVNIVREREKGNIEQINVTPLSKPLFMMGKMIPYGLIGIVQFSIGLLVIHFGFGVPIVGSVPLLYGVAVLYLTVVLAAGFIISEISENQSQAMFTTLFLIFIFVLLSGLLTPVESMPQWAQELNRLNPLAYMVDMMRRIILKGSDFVDLWREIAILVALSVTLNITAIVNYRKSAS